MSDHQKLQNTINQIKSGSLEEAINDYPNIETESKDEKTLSVHIFRRVLTRVNAITKAESLLTRAFYKPD